MPSSSFHGLIGRPPVSRPSLLQRGAGGILGRLRCRPLPTAAVVRPRPGSPGHSGSWTFLLEHRLQFQNLCSPRLILGWTGTNRGQGRA